MGSLWILFCCVGLDTPGPDAVFGLVARLKPGDRFDSTAFAVVSVLLHPWLRLSSDFYDTLKDVIFGALCLQSEHLMIQILGVVSWLYLFLFHTWFLLVGDKGNLNLNWFVEFILHPWFLCLGFDMLL